MEGPQFSTRGRERAAPGWGASLIGMTVMPEAKLAREAEICYALVALPTDYDCWKPHPAHLDQAKLIEEILGEREGRDAERDRAHPPRHPEDLPSSARRPAPASRRWRSRSGRTRRGSRRTSRERLRPILGKYLPELGRVLAGAYGAAAPAAARARRRRAPRGPPRTAPARSPARRVVRARAVSTRGGPSPSRAARAGEGDELGRGARVTRNVRPRSACAAVAPRQTMAARPHDRDLGVEPGAAGARSRRRRLLVDASLAARPPT